jgi:hypothetical protein
MVFGSRQAHRRTARPIHYRDEVDEAAQWLPLIPIQRNCADLGIHHVLPLDCR